jgi:uncharacterized protein YjaZ
MNDDSSDCRFGVLTRVYLKRAFIRYFRSKADWDDEPIQGWIDLDKFRVVADLTLGYVSRSTLSQRSIFDIKLRNVKFVSQKENAYDELKSHTLT